MAKTFIFLNLIQAKYLLTFDTNLANILNYYINLIFLV
jgi:hypothetical protein